MDATANRELFDSVVDEFTDLALMPAERQLLVRLGTRLSGMSMLDLGVGTGRTGYTFAPLVRHYVGFDYSPRMVERARALLGSGPGIDLVVGDARDLSPLREVDGFEGFDLVLFSFCGIDAVDHEDRLKILAEVRSVLTPTGQFLFSAHSLGTLPLSTEQPWPKRSRESLLRKGYRSLHGIRYAREARRSNRALDLHAARERGWVVFRDPAHGFRLGAYYIDPEQQVAQLRGTGFEVDAVFDQAGNEVSLPHYSRDSWLDYLCSPTAG
ncbi:MAG: class I SAM-dependent methyltransferase [Actinobacteria bacterium]|nr:class I SAM-dependent methyltransferase [Actinomycetota bacterium]